MLQILSKSKCNDSRSRGHSRGMFLTLAVVATVFWANLAFFAGPPVKGVSSKLSALHSKALARSQRIASAAEKEEEKQTGHMVNNKGNFQVDPEEMAVQQKLREHQESAVKLDAATEVRTLVQYNHGFAVMSTNSIGHPGYPGGSVVGFAPDELGRPLFAFSSMSSHTTDLLKDKRCSLTVAAKEFKGAADGRVNLIGEATKIESEEERKAAREVYLKKHPKAFWVDFGDFTWMRMEVQHVRFVGGFARAGSVTAEDYAAATPDPISAFAAGVAGHMNADHRDSTIAMVRNYVGVDVDDAEITSMDSLGMYVKVSRTPKAADQMQQFKIRLPFIRKLQDRKDAKDVIVEMTKASAEFLPKKDKADA
eukprot:TRINITY_DN11833_c1_g1_i1.p1 TRINITY_DN11833_c1_g1~~TRINITY_DN11833_c1_g1_i1.p1  ORF type:complete len:366 (+),score=84.73 TRINITY_DN11833_c1_g1_i1:50-1147(+)